MEKVITLEKALKRIEELENENAELREELEKYGYVRKNHNRRHDIDLEVALTSRLNHARSRITERFHEIVLALQRLAHLTRINALACNLAVGHELVSRRVGIRMLFHHSSHSTKSSTALPAGALIP